MRKRVQDLEEENSACKEELQELRETEAALVSEKQTAIE
jgi:hypothetical protein